MIQELKITSDGSHTIYVPELDEHYHSVHGAIQESEHIFIRSGFDTCDAIPSEILEIGFGTGLNAFLTCIRSIELSREVRYTSLEKYPISYELAMELNYSSILGKAYENIFSLIHSTNWNTGIKITDYFTLEKTELDLTVTKPKGSYDLIYFDAFGPDKQPEIWTKEIFESIAEVTKPGGILVTYSAKGETKRKLRNCGFDVKLLPGPPGKRHIIRAVKLK